MSNGDIAISGGPKANEILIYRHNYECERGRKDQLKLVDAIDTGERKTVQILETHDAFIIVVQEQSSFLVFYREEN